MANVTLTTGFTNNGQFPVDGKTYFLTQSDLADLGANDQNAYIYYERMQTIVAEDGSEWEWREEKSQGEQGLIDPSFTYPDNVVSNGIDYSNRTFNFFTVGDLNEPTSDGNFVRKADGDTYTWEAMDSTDDLPEGSSNLYYPQDDKDKVAFIEITQDVDLDVVEEETYFNSTLAPDVETTETVGGIEAGTTVAQLTGDTFSSLFENMLFPSISAYIDTDASLSLSGYDTSSVEVGTVYSFTASMDFETGIIDNGDGSEAGPVNGDALTFELTNPDGNSYDNASVTDNSDSTTTQDYTYVDSGSQTWTLDSTNTAGTTTYENNKGQSQTITEIEDAKAVVAYSTSFSKTAYFPLIYGMNSTDGSSGGTAFYDLTLTHEVANTGDRTVTLDGTDQYIYFAYPSSFGTLSQIKDNNGFDVTGSFNIYTVDVTSTGFTTDWTEEYNIYRSASVTTVNSSDYEFNF